MGAIVTMGNEHRFHRKVPGSTMSKPQKELLLAAVLGLLFTQSALAQDMSFDLDEAESEPADANNQPTDEGFSGDVIGELTGSGVSAQTSGQASTAPRKKEAAEEIYAVQQIYALRLNRLELAPSVAFNINDPYATHPAVGIALNYWWTNVLAIGANFLWYQGLGNTEKGGSDLNFHLGRSMRLGVPVNEWQLGAHLNFTYVPLYGKFNMFREFIFQWDGYIVGGVGLMRTRPYPVIDPANREFDFGMRVAFNVGLGLRVFVSRWLAVFGELRDYIFLERLENQQVALDPVEQTNPDTWLSGNELTHNMTVQVGLTVFFPFKFEYRKPK